MAKFDPFADGAERRLPDSTERENGMLCGPADRTLFNGLFWRIESELGNVISEAGLAGSDDDMTQLLQAIQALIEAATGGGDPSSYLLLAQARTRLPIYPEVQNLTGHFGVISPGVGQIRIPAGVNFLHRGIAPVVTALTDFATDPSKTYHLRWNPTDGWTLKDLASGVYNAGALPETNEIFDSKYDDMLAARVITNSSNVPTITNLQNRNVMSSDQRNNGPADVYTSGSGNDGGIYRNTFIMNLARTPLVMMRGFATQNAGPPLVHGGANLISEEVYTRYTATAAVSTDWHIALAPGTVFGELVLKAISK